MFGRWDSLGCMMPGCMWRNCFCSSFHLRPRVTHQDDDLCFREARTQHFGDGQDSSRHLFGRVLVIVGPYPQHHHLGQRPATL